LPEKNRKGRHAAGAAGANIALSLFAGNICNQQVIGSNPFVGSSEKE
jgi:hypothetical protein